MGKIKAEALRVLAERIKNAEKGSSEDFKQLSKAFQNLLVYETNDEQLADKAVNSSEGFTSDFLNGHVDTDESEKELIRQLQEAAAKYYNDRSALQHSSERLNRMQIAEELYQLTGQALEPEKEAQPEENDLLSPPENAEEMNQLIPPENAEAPAVPAPTQEVDMQALREAIILNLDNDIDEQSNRTKGTQLAIDIAEINLRKLKHENATTNDLDHPSIHARNYLIENYSSFRKNLSDKDTDAFELFNSLDHLKNKPEDFKREFFASYKNKFQKDCTQSAYLALLNLKFQPDTDELNNNIFPEISNRIPSVQDSLNLIYTETEKQIKSAVNSADTTYAAEKWFITDPETKNVSVDNSLVSGAMRAVLSTSHPADSPFERHFTEELDEAYQKAAPTEKFSNLILQTLSRLEKSNILPSPERSEDLTEKIRQIQILEQKIDALAKIKNIQADFSEVYKKTVEIQKGNNPLPLKYYQKLQKSVDASKELLESNAWLSKEHKDKADSIGEHIEALNCKDNLARQAPYRDMFDSEREKLRDMLIPHIQSAESYSEVLKGIIKDLSTLRKAQKKTEKTRIDAIVSSLTKLEEQASKRNAYGNDALVDPKELESVHENAKALKEAGVSDKLLNRLCALSTPLEEYVAGKLTSPITSFVSSLNNNYKALNDAGYMSGSSGEFKKMMEKLKALQEEVENNPKLLGGDLHQIDYNDPAFIRKFDEMKSSAAEYVNAKLMQDKNANRSARFGIALKLMNLDGIRPANKAEKTAEISNAKDQAFHRELITDFKNILRNTDLSQPGEAEKLMGFSEKDLDEIRQYTMNDLNGFRKKDEALLSGMKKVLNVIVKEKSAWEILKNKGNATPGQIAQANIDVMLGYQLRHYIGEKTGEDRLKAYRAFGKSDSKKLDEWKAKQLNDAKKMAKAAKGIQKEGKAFDPTRKLAAPKKDEPSLLQ